MGDRTFLEAQDELAGRWAAELDKATSDEERGQTMLGFVLERERLRMGVSKPGPRRDAVDAETLAKLTRPTALGPEHSAVEVVLRRLADDPSSAFT